MPAGSLTSRAPAPPLRSKRLLALAGDERLVEQIRRGNELAFEVAFERHGAGILAFCRHMLGSREEAEDAVQHTFAAAFRDLQRGGERRIALRPWLYAIARNRCLSLLRARREQYSELGEIPTDGLSDEVERRAELRELLTDMRELPDDQRAALLLAEAAGMSHAEVAEVLGCEVASVKGLVFRARSGLIDRRTARETPCTEIREQLATMHGGALRRKELRHHLRRCAGCSAYREEVRRQRQLLAVALPIVPSVGLKSSVLAAVGLGGGGATAGGMAGGGAILGSLGSGAVAKVAIAGVLATGGAVAGEAVVERSQDERAPAAATVGDIRSGDRNGNGEGPAEGHGQGKRLSQERSHGRRGLERRSERSRGRGPRSPAGPGRTRGRADRPAHGNEGRTLGREKRAARVEAAPRTKPERAPREAPRVKSERPVVPEVGAPKPRPERAPAPTEEAPPVIVPEAEPLPEPPTAEKVKPVK